MRNLSAPQLVKEKAMWRTKLYLHLYRSTLSWCMCNFTSNLCWCWALSPRSLFPLIRTRCFLFSSLEYNSARYSITEKDWTVVSRQNTDQQSRLFPANWINKCLIFSKRAGKLIVEFDCFLVRYGFTFLSLPTADPSHCFSLSGPPNRQITHIFQITARPL